MMNNLAKKELRSFLQSVRDLTEADNDIPRADSAYAAAYLTQTTGKKVSKARGAALLRHLEKLGYLHSTDGGKYGLTKGGIKLCVEKLIPRISRAKAEQLVVDLLKRAAEINARDELTDRVARIYAFGSYITDADDLGDIDLVVELEQRRRGEEHRAANEARIKAAGKILGWEAGFTFGHQEVKRLLKNRNRYLSLQHTLEEIGQINAPYRQIYPDKGPIIIPHPDLPPLQASIGSTH